MITHTHTHIYIYIYMKIVVKDEQKNAYYGESLHIFSHGTYYASVFLFVVLSQCFFNRAMGRPKDNSGDMDLEGFDVETFMEMVNAAGLRFHKTCDEREDFSETRNVSALGDVGRGRPRHVISESSYEYMNNNDHD